MHAYSQVKFPIAHLILEECSSFEVISKILPLDITENITHAKIEHSDTELELPGKMTDIFPNIKKLEIYKLGQISVTTMTEDHKWPEKLEHLDLISIRNMTKLPNFNQSNIISLDLNKCNNLDDISNVKFLPKLQNIILYKIKALEKLPPRIFQHNTALQKLVINNAKITNLEPETWKGLENLRIFHLEKNPVKISNLPGFFKHCPKLQDIFWAPNYSCDLPRYFLTSGNTEVHR